MAPAEQRRTPTPPRHLLVVSVSSTPPLVPPSPTGSPPPECSLQLTIYDTFWFPIPPVERLFLYRLTPNTDRPGDGVAFTVAEYNGGGADDSIFDGVATDDPRVVTGIAPLAMLMLLPGLRQPSASPCTTPPSMARPPRTSSTPGRWPPPCHRPEPPPRRLVPTSRRHEMPAGQLLATFTLSRDDIERVKAAVAAKAARRGVTQLPQCTSLVATLGFPKRRRAPPPRTPAASTDGGGRICLLFSIDHRLRMNTPLHSNYLGNCVGPALAVAPKAALAGAGKGGLLAACAIDEAVSPVRTCSMGAWTDKLREVAVRPTRWAFHVYEMDLGFGTPAKVDIVSVARTGALAVAESRRGDGRMEVGVPLPPDDMERFRICFADAIAGLHARRVDMIDREAA
ncbi:hypothetical protein HU200_033353 [Digitaria exilis]|uniref:Uncharacterized protein n=1 Tax=Digitaria exilis TaxID=1010633 RepID=A0A835BLX0_9POAL|nr:hypothetical protein HU200_033353 [Digitaria exilis]